MQTVIDKVISKSLIIAVLAMCLVSCINENAAKKLDSFVDNAELKSGIYDAKDWEKSINQYEKIVEEYSASVKNYSEAEKQIAARAMGRYHSLLLKNGIQASASYLNELRTILPSYFEGLIEGIDEDSEKLEKSLEGLFDTEDLEKAFEDLDTKLERIFGEIDEK